MYFFPVCFPSNVTCSKPAPKSIKTRLNGCAFISLNLVDRVNLAKENGHSYFYMVICGKGLCHLNLPIKIKQFSWLLCSCLHIHLFYMIVEYPQTLF